MSTQPVASRLTAAVAVALLSVVGFGCGDPSPTEAAAGARADQARTVAREAGLSTPVQDFLATAARAVTATYTVSYRSAEGGRIEVVHDPPKRRVDVTDPTPAATEGAPPPPQPVTRRVIDDGDRTFECTKAGSDWTCATASAATADPGASSATDVERTASVLGAARRSYDFRIERRTIAGTSATCLLTTRKPAHASDPTLGERGVLCIAPSGVTLLVQSGSSTLEALAYKTTVPAAAFTRPDGRAGS